MSYGRETKDREVARGEKLLLNENPLLVMPRLATLIGLNEAIVLQQVHYWLTLYRRAEQHLPARQRKHFHQGHWWVYNSKSAWQENFPFWHRSTVARTLDSLRTPCRPAGESAPQVERGPLLLTGNFNRAGFDKTLWYAIDYREVGRLEHRRTSHQDDAIEDSKMSQASTQDGAMDDSRMGRSSHQNGAIDDSKMDSPIPETTQRPASEKTREAAESFSEQQLRADLALQVTRSTYLRVIEPLSFCRKDGRLVVSAGDTHLGRSALALAEDRLRPVIAGAGGLSQEEVVFIEEPAGRARPPP